MNYFLSRNALLRALGSATALSALVSLAVVPVHGGTPAADASKPNADTALVGLVVARDAKTGELRAPTAKERRQLAKEQARLTAANKGETKGPKPLESVTLANGAVVTTLDSSTDVYSVAAKGADGKLHTACVTGDKVDATMAAAQDGKLTKKEVLDEK